MKILLIENEPIWQTKIAMLLEELGYNDPVICGTYAGITESLQLHKPDFIISDILLDEQNVFTFFETYPCAQPILFITSSESELLYKRAYRMQHTHYLVKPFHKISLKAAIDVLHKVNGAAAQEERHCITVRGIYNEKIELSESDIVYIKAELNYCIIKTLHNKFVIKSSLSSLSLENSLIRVHKSYLINPAFIEKTDLAHKVIVIAADHIPIGRKYKDNIYQYLSNTATK